MTREDQSTARSHLAGDVKGRSARGGAATIAGQGLVFACQLAGLFILARLLPPAQHGLVAMATAFTGFLALFKDLGLSMATVQRREISDLQVSRLFWVNLLLGVLVALLVAATAPLVAWFYGREELVGIILVMSMPFICYGLSAQHLALLKRQMRYGRLALVEVASVATGVSFAVVAARLGAGYWALALQPLAISACCAGAAWLACPWRPSRPRSGGSVRELLAFGGNIVGHDVLNYFFRNLDDVLVGKTAGSTVLGLYAKAYTLAMLPIKLINTPLSQVTISGLSLLQADPDRYRHYYLLAVRYIAFATMPIFALLIFLAPQVITLLLGEQWAGAGTFFRILAVGAFFQPITNTTGWLFISSGRTRRMFLWRVRTFALPLALYLGGAWLAGAKGVAWGHTISVLLLTIPCIRYACQGTRIGVGQVLAVTIRPLAASLTAAATSWAVWLHWESLALALPTMALAYPLYSCILAGSLRPITDFVQILNNYILRKDR